MYSQYLPETVEWADPGTPSYDYEYEKDDDGRDFLNIDGSSMDVNINAEKASDVEDDK